MAKPKVFATHSLFEAARQILQETCEVEYWAKPERPPREEVLRRLKDKEGLICLLTEKVNEELLKAAPKLRIAANVAVGFDNIDVAACTKRNVAATNTPGVLDETTADFAWTLMRAVARRASGFQMKVIYTDAVRADAGMEKELKAEFRDMNTLLAESDFVSVHVPLLPETRGLFDATKFQRMKPTAFLINTSRGPVVDEAALVAALEAGKIAGAGLDVYENEPFIHPGLKRANVVLAPHIASASLETRTKMACIAAENVVALFAGKRPPNILNPEVLKAT